MDTAAALAPLAAVAPAVLLDTAGGAQVVQLVDPDEPHTVLAHLRTAAAHPGPVLVYVVGQLMLDSKQQLPHLALARTVPKTARYTALPWHWLLSELGHRPMGSTTVFADLVADEATWPTLTAERLATGLTVYGCVAPPPRRRQLSTPHYTRAVAAALRAATVRPALVQLHQHAVEQSGLGRGSELLISPHQAVMGSPGDRPPLPAALADMPPVDAVDQPWQAAMLEQPAAPSREAGSLPTALPEPGRVPQFEQRPGAGAAPTSGHQVPGVAGEAPPAASDRLPAVASAPPTAAPPPASSPPQASAPPHASWPAPDSQQAPGYPTAPGPTPAELGFAPGGAAPAWPGSAPTTPARGGEGNAAAEPADALPSVPAARAAEPSPSRPTAAPATTAEAAHDPHGAILEAARAGRHSEAAAMAAAWEQDAFRSAGPDSPQALHWLEVRADLARLAGDPARASELWMAAATTRLSAGQAEDQPDVESAVDRAHHQWQHVSDPARARALATELIALRTRVPGRRPGALQAIQARVESLRAVRAS